jgi:hypothetical protein
MVQAKFVNRPRFGPSFYSIAHNRKRGGTCDLSKMCPHWERLIPYLESPLELDLRTLGLNSVEWRCFFSGEQLFMPIGGLQYNGRDTDNVTQKPVCSLNAPSGHRFPETQVHGM